MVVPEFLVCDQIVIATDETILWKGINYDLIAYAHDILLNDLDGAIVLDVNDVEDDTGAYRFTLTLDDVVALRSILKANPGSGLHKEYINIGQQLCPDGNHDIGRHTSGAMFTYIDLKAALEGLTESGFPTMVWDTVLTGPEDNFL